MEVGRKWRTNHLTMKYKRNKKGQFISKRAAKLHRKRELERAHASLTAFLSVAILIVTIVTSTAVFMPYETSWAREYSIREIVAQENFGDVNPFKEKIEAYENEEARIERIEAILYPNETVQRYDYWTKLSKEYNVKLDTMRAIAYCESGHLGHAVNDNGWSIDRGLFQLNDYYHEERAYGLGLDIHHNNWDNARYAFMLASDAGYAPWSASQACWDKANPGW